MVYFYSAVARRSRGVIRSIFAPALTVLQLDRSDPLSVSVNQIADGQEYSVSIGRAVWSPKALDLPTDAAPEPLQGEYDIFGVVRSVSGGSVVLVTAERHLVQVTLDGNAEYNGG